MNMKQIGLALLFTLPLGFAASAPVFAAITTEDTLLASEYNVPVSTVSQMRKNGAGSREIEDRLRAAQSLGRANSKSFTSTRQALRRVNARRDRGANWSEVSQ